eukprot:6208425-Pleurochrysis_carterae.AAC.1
MTRRKRTTSTTLHLTALTPLSRLCFCLFSFASLAAASAAVLQQHINLALFQDISDISISEGSCETGQFKAGRCFYFIDRAAVAVAALRAIEDFNNRDNRIISRFGDPDVVACQKNVSFAGFWDTKGSGIEALRNLLSVLNQTRLDVLISSTGSDRATAIAPTLGLLSIPTIAAAATSPALSDVDRFPTFMRTVPSDDGAAKAICNFWGNNLELLDAAVIYVADPFGDGYAQAVLKHCVFGGTVPTPQQLYASTDTSAQSFRIEIFGFEQSSAVSIESAVARFGASKINVALVVALGQDNPSVLQEAYNRGFLRSVPQSLWALSDGARLNMLDLLSEPARHAVSGSIR